MGAFCNYDDLDVRWPSTNDKATTRLTFKDHKEKKEREANDKMERSDSVVECLTRGQGPRGLTGVTALWYLSKTHLS